MSFNPTGAQGITLSQFGGLVTETSAADLPDGLSPANQDCTFIPGSVLSRPGVQKVFASALPGAPNVTYAKSYVDPTGKITNLYYDSLGDFYAEDVLATPGTVTKLFMSTAGVFLRSATLFGREYLAITDGLHGQEMPLQYDGQFIDRVTQDGPAESASVNSLIIPPVSTSGSVSHPSLAMSGMQTADFNPSGYFTSAVISLSSPTSSPIMAVGNTVTVTGNANSVFNGTFYIISKLNPSQYKVYFFSATAQLGAGGTVSAAFGKTMTRTNNVVTVYTAGVHNLQVGFQAQITNVTASQIGGGIAFSTINNEDLPGLATIQTNNPHGLVPGLFVSISGVPQKSVGGGGLASINRQGELVTATTLSPHGLSPGAVVTLAGMGPDATFNGTFSVLNVISTTAFTYYQTEPTNVTMAPPSSGGVFINWPIPNGPSPTYFQVQSAPTANTFQVALNYSDGSWSGGNVSYAWDGTFYVSAVLDAHTFQYQQYGPDDSTTMVGVVTPFGQASPGKHQMQVLFLTRQGYITRPSPPVNFVANGGQYVAVSNIPIGPSNVVARILAFTGSQGAYFYYIPVPAQVNGQTVSTGTQINDNTTTSAVFDFGDNTLFAATAISIPGNNLANQIVLDSCLGFGFYATRLLSYGTRNRIQNLLNLGFEGGWRASTPTVPLGWDSTANNGGFLSTDHITGNTWNIVVTGDGNPYGLLTQGMYQDAYGAPIATGNTLYKIRGWFNAATDLPGLNFFARLFSPSTGFVAFAQVNGASMIPGGGYLEATFNTKTPQAIPTDFILTIYANGTANNGLTIDELSIIYAQTPYLDGIIWGSYVDNPEGIDGVTGQFGPSIDTHKVMDFGVLRDTLYMLTQDPGGRVHETNNNGVTEPSGWTVNEVSSEGGALSAFCLTKAQASDSTASGGEEWLAWASSSGARIFGGSQPWKITQEIQPNWDTINPAGNTFVWAFNDSVNRIIYFGLPTRTDTQYPVQVWTMSYRGLDTAEQIYGANPLAAAQSPYARKWSPWELAMRGGSMMYRKQGVLQPVLWTGAAFGQVYTLNPAKLTDDDYGQIRSFYMTYFFVQAATEVGLGLGQARKQVQYVAADISGVGQVKITPVINRFGQDWPLTGVRDLQLDPNFDLEWSGGVAQGQRIAFRIESLPKTGTDNGFNLSRFIVWMTKSKHLPIRGTSH